jgi:hypothetical protein
VPTWRKARTQHAFFHAAALPISNTPLASSHSYLSVRLCSLLRILLARDSNQKHHPNQIPTSLTPPPFLSPSAQSSSYFPTYPLSHLRNCCNRLPMLNPTGYWPWLTVFSLTGICAMSLAWSLSAFVKLRLYPSAYPNPDMKLDTETVVGGQDTARGPETASQSETSGPQGNDDDHPSIHHSHINPEVRRSQNVPTALSDV